MYADAQRRVNLATAWRTLSVDRNYYGAWEEWGNRDDLPIKR